MISNDFLPSLPVSQLLKTKLNDKNHDMQTHEVRSWQLLMMPIQGTSQRQESMKYYVQNKALQIPNVLNNVVLHISTSDFCNSSTVPPLGNFFQRKMLVVRVLCCGQGLNPKPPSYSFQCSSSTTLCQKVLVQSMRKKRLQHTIQDNK